MPAAEDPQLEETPQPSSKSDTTLIGEDEKQDSVTEIESLCMNCHENGTTKLLLYHIPYFREVLLSSFHCENCGQHDTSIQSAGKIQENGSKYTLKVDDKRDLERQVVRNDTAIIRFEEIDVELPTGHSQLTNLEGILLKTCTDLEATQELLKSQSIEAYTKMQEIVDKLKSYMDSSGLPFTLTISDSTGNSFIEPTPGDKLSKYTRLDFKRTPGQNEELGLGEAAAATDDDIVPEGLEDSEIVNGKVYVFQEVCPACSKVCKVTMQKVEIPHFKEVIIMATNCDECNYRTSEVKTGGAVPGKGRRITLRVERMEDLSRDLLKSETCSLSCPEIELNVEPGTLGGRFTTVEGLITQVRDQLRGQVYDIETEGPGQGVSGGDSMAAETKEQWDDFFGKLTSILKVEQLFHIVLSDPLANSYVQSLSDAVLDPQIKIEDYERTEDEKEHLGLNDMVTEGYEDDAATSKQENEVAAVPEAT